MKSDSFARSDGEDYKLRRVHAENCEKLITREYELISKLDLFFEEKNE